MIEFGTNLSTWPDIFTMAANIPGAQSMELGAWPKNLWEIATALATAEK